MNIRLTPKEKFTLELAARQAGKSQAAFVVECLREKFGNKHSSLMATPSGNRASKYLPDLVWHPLECHRIVNMGIHAPSLLDSREHLIWTVIKENHGYWVDREPVFPNIRDDWNEIQTEAERIGRGTPSP